MLRKLIKYDFIRIEKTVVFFAAAALLLSCVTRFLNEISDKSAILTIIDKFALLLYVVSLIALILVTFAMCMIRFKRNIYHDESYLVHTLPVSRGTVYHSKVISGVMALILSTLVFTACVAIVMLNQHSIEQLKSILSNSDYVTILLAFLFAYLFESIFILLAAFIGIEIGHRRGSKKVFHSVLAAVIIYGVVQTLGSVILIFLRLIDTDINTLYTASLGTYGIDLLTNTMKRFSWILTSLYFVCDIALFIAGKKLLEKGVNVE